MGLDMYLNAHQYVSPYSNAKLHGELDAVLSSVFPTMKEKVSGVTFEAAYWRKSNAIHNWFVTNVQDGRDECQESDVSKEQLKELVELCKTVLADPMRASELLPTLGGFFFGSIAYDDWYFEDINQTINMLTPLITDPAYEGFEFSYQSSW